MIKNANYMDNGLPYLSCPYDYNLYTNKAADTVQWQTLTDNNNVDWIILRAGLANATPESTATLFAPAHADNPLPLWKEEDYKTLETSGYHFKKITTDEILNNYFDTDDKVLINYTHMLALFSTGYTDVGWEIELQAALKEQGSDLTQYIAETTRHGRNPEKQALFVMMDARSNPTSKE